VLKHLDYLDGFDGGATGRAISAFSRIFEAAIIDDSMQLVWALIGIESLYVKGKTSIVEQVRDKVQAFLGQPETYKKKLGSMYEFRSRFIHGDLDFIPLYLVGDARSVVERYEIEQTEAVDMAIAILVASLQELILRDWSGLDFTYTVSNIAN